MDAQLKTHKQIDRSLSGHPLELGDGWAVVELHTQECMAVDEHGLVHGGFIFSMADYAAMVAVGDPYVVLGSASVRFIKPVRIGETLVARAQVNEVDGRKQTVDVRVFRAGQEVFSGTFTCFVLAGHVLERTG